MTDVEKAREIADKIVKASNEKGELNDYHDVKESALEMSEWKNEQFKCLIDTEITRIKDNMTKCNIGEIYGSTIDAGYRMAVEHMLQIMENLKSKI